MDRTTKLAFLQRCRLFAGVPPESLERVAALARTQDLAGGEALCSQDMPATALAVVTSGSLWATRTHGDKTVQLAVAGPGAAVGLAAALLGAHFAKVRALRPSSLLRLDAEDLRATLEGDPTLGATVWRNAALLLAERLRWLTCFCAEVATPPEESTEREVAVSAPAMHEAADAGATALSPGIREAA